MMLVGTPYAPLVAGSLSLVLFLRPSCAASIALTPPPDPLGNANVHTGERALWLPHGAASCRVAKAHQPPARCYDVPCAQVAEQEVARVQAP